VSTNQDNGSAEDSQEPAELSWCEPDFMLRALVESVNSPRAGGREAGMSLILTLPGGVVAGRLIPAAVWWDEQAAIMREAGAEGLGEVFGEAADTYRRLAEEAEQQPGPSTARYIHLADARVYAPGGMPLPVQGMRWRGRLSDVSGWAFGTLSVAGEQPAVPPEQDDTYVSNQDETL
jgi:hypothetical protein